MAENKGLGLQETKGSFQLSGTVSGTKSDKFYKETMTKTNKPFRSIGFAVNVDNGKGVYVSLNGMEKAEVCFSKSEGKGQKSTTKKVPWKDRFTFAEKDFKPLGVNVGVSKIVDKSGKEVNDKKVLVEYDACKEIGDNLVDDKSVFVKGKVEYSTYNDKHQTKFVPQQVSLCKDIDFTAEEFTPTADFQQVIIFTGIKPNEDKTKFTISAKIVTYNTIEDAEFYVTNPSLANIFKKNLKPYTAIKVWGNINVEKDTEEVTTDDCWGDSNNMDKVNSPTTRELIITGADKNSVDTETYTEEIIEKALEKMKSEKNAKNDYGDSGDDWGSTDTSKASSEDDEW